MRGAAALHGLLLSSNQQFSSSVDNVVPLEEDVPAMVYALADPGVHDSVCPNGRAAMFEVATEFITTCVHAGLAVSSAVFVHVNSSVLVQSAVRFTGCELDCIHRACLRDDLVGCLQSLEFEKFFL